MGKEESSFIRGANTVFGAGCGCLVFILIVFILIIFILWFFSDKGQEIDRYVSETPYMRKTKEEYNKIYQKLSLNEKKIKNTSFEINSSDIEKHLSNLQDNVINYRVVVTYNPTVQRNVKVFRTNKPDIVLDCALLTKINVFEKREEEKEFSKTPVEESAVYDMKKRLVAVGNMNYKNFGLDIYDFYPNLDFQKYDFQCE